MTGVVNLMSLTFVPGGRRTVGLLDLRAVKMESQHLPKTDRATEDSVCISLRQPQQPSWDDGQVSEHSA